MRDTTRRTPPGARYSDSSGRPVSAKAGGPAAAETVLKQGDAELQRGFERTKGNEKRDLWIILFIVVDVD